MTDVPCKECGAYKGHSPKCSLIDFESARELLKVYYDLWLTKETWIRKRMKQAFDQVRQLQGKVAILKNENNKLRKKLTRKPKVI